MSLTTWLQEQWLRLQDAPLFELRRLCLFLAVITLPMGHLLGVSLLLVSALLGIGAIRWRPGGQALSLGLPLMVAYVLVVLAEVLSPNEWPDTLETLFNYLPLVLLPVLFATCLRSGVDSMQLSRAVLVASFLMAGMAIVEVFVFSQAFADGNVVDLISISRQEFALVAFLYGLILVQALLLNREPMVNATPWPWLVSGILSCLLCVGLTKTYTMFLPTAVVLVVGLFAVCFNSRRLWLGPSLMVVLVFSAVTASTLPVVQEEYTAIFADVSRALAGEPREGKLAQLLSLWLSGWHMAQDQIIVGHGNIDAVRVAAQDYRFEDWPTFAFSFHFKSAFVDHIVLFGALGLAALLIVLMAPLVMIGPMWFRQYTGIIVLGTTLYAMLGRFLNNDITGAVMLVVWLSLLLTQAIVNKRRA